MKQQAAEAGHDGLSRPRVVGEQETESWLGEELVVYRLELMGQRADVRNRDRGHLLGECGLDPSRLDAEAKLLSVPVEGWGFRYVEELDLAKLLLGECDRSRPSACS